MCCLILTSGCAAVVDCDVAPPVERGPPGSLSDTGLFCGRPDQFAHDVVAYAPTFRSWSDGMLIRRWIRLPETGSIDTRDMDHWSFPLGTRLWKEIASEDSLLETQLAERWGPNDTDWTFATYRWRPDRVDADILETGERDVSGTSYDVAPSRTCGACHDSLPERVLGFGAVQLANEIGRAAAAELSDRFSHPPAIASPVLADDPKSRAALGVLHANCGGCHHDGPGAAASSMRLRLRVGQRPVEDTSAYRTTVGVATETFADLATRITPGDTSASALFFRLSSRGNIAQMPPVGTERIDHAGAIVVGAWINSLER